MGTSILKPSHDKQLGRLNVKSIELTNTENAKKKNRTQLFLILMSNRLITEHIVKKCRIPKKIKLFLFKKKVTDVINAQINNRTPRRLKNLVMKSSERHKSLEDIPEMIIKLAPTDCANNSGNP